MTRICGPDALESLKLAWEEVRVERVIHFVEIDVVEQVGSLHDGVQPDAFIAADEDGLLETHVEGVEGGATAAVARRIERRSVIEIERESILQARRPHRKWQAAVRVGDGR